MTRGTVWKHDPEFPFAAEAHPLGRDVIRDWVIGTPLATPNENCRALAATAVSATRTAGRNLSYLKTRSGAEEIRLAVWRPPGAG
jgi:hypothetical protein